MNRNELILDPRSRTDLQRRLEELAASYTPEWRFDRRNPDVGSTLALIYTNQMADNIRRYNQLPEKYHTEFVNMLGLTLQPAYPASGVVVAELMRESVPGVALPRGTRLTAQGNNGMPIVFETTGDVYLTSARISDVVAVSGTMGRINSLLGGPARAELFPGEWEPVEVKTEKSALLPEGEEPSVPEFELFDFEQRGIERNAALLYHRSVFSGDETVPVRIRMELVDGLCLTHGLTDESLWRWSYYDGEKLRPFARVEVRDGVVCLWRDGPSGSVTVDGIEYHLICLEALETISSSLEVKDLRIASQGENTPPQVILRDGEELESGECMPFGENVSLFDECYIGDDLVFSQQDAQITLSFHLSSRKKIMNLTAQQEEDELKVIKRKPQALQYDVAAAAPERIALEYYNGRGWRRLPCSNEFASVLDGTHGGDFTITFRCPEDWTAVPVNGYEGRSLRLRVTQADNCYLLPCEHTMPVLRNVRLSYHYPQPWKQPQRVEVVCGTHRENVTRPLLEGRGVSLFRPLPYPGAALYIGFDRPLEGAPISMLFEVEENVHFHMEPVSFEYSTRNGFKQMKVVDGTGHFSGAGTVLFMPPSDFAAAELEGVRRWWLRIRGGKNALQGYHAKIRNIRLNAVDVRNQQTQPEEELYVDVTLPNMEFPLMARNILSADVFVSELGQMSRHQMRRMLEQKPQDTRVEHDFMGEITAFYVRWTEVENFDRSQPGDRHYMIDRARSMLVFGDGVHVRIPQAQQGAAILVRAISCDGSVGNVPAGAVDSFYGNMMYVQSVTNPVATYAGNDLEDLESARNRGADLLSNRGRLISERDFVRAVRTFSGSIEKVRCMAGRDIDGRSDPEVITIAVMTRDYREGANAFHNIRHPLHRQLLERCEVTLKPECLVLAEPVYVEITVSVWVKVEGTAQSFDIQNMVLDSIREFLEPLERPGYSGWDIGCLPTEEQLNMLLQSLRFDGHVERVIPVARYVDREGTHETTLDRLPDTPFAIGVNGDHRVYIEFQ